MSKKSAVHLKKVDEAVRILNTTTGVNVPMTMTLAGFPKKETTNETVRRMLCRRLEAVQAKQRTPCRDAPAAAVRIVTNDTDLSPLTGKDNDPSTTTTSNMTTTGPTHPKPKRKQICSTVSAIQQRRIDHVAAKRHKSDAHKAAVRYLILRSRSGMACPSGRCTNTSRRSTKLALRSRRSLVTRRRKNSSMRRRSRWVPLGIFRPWHTSFYARLTRASCRSTK
jgi:hypothetical protein